MARRSSQKSRRDPNAPKQKMGAWHTFFSDHREEVTKQNPNLSYQDITKKLGELWRQSDENTKRRYQKQYETDQVEYSQKLAAYKDEQNKKRKSSKSKKNNSQAKKGNNNNNNNNNDESNENNDQM